MTHSRISLLKDGASQTLPKLATLELCKAPLGIQRLTAFSILPEDGCWLVGVQDGMLLNPVPIPAPPGGLVLTSASAWQTDLGQLEPVMDEHLKHEQSLALFHLNEALAKVRAWVEVDLSPELVKRPNGNSKPG